MMSSLATSSPVSASTLAYLMRWPVLRLIWLKLTFSVSEVAGYSATGQVTSERRKKPFELARGAMRYSEKRNSRPARITPGNRVSSERGRNSLNGVNRVRLGARDCAGGDRLLGPPIRHVRPLDQAGASKSPAPPPARAGRPDQKTGCEEKVMVRVHHCSSGIHASPSHLEGRRFCRDTLRRPACACSSLKTTRISTDS